MTTGSRRATPAAVPAGEATELHFEPMNHPGHLVRRLHQICVAVFLDAAKDYNITHVQYATLKAIERFPGVDQTRVGKLVALDRQTTSNVVTRLQQNGLIERTRKDKRTYALHITGPGRALIEVMQPRIAEIDEVILGPLSPDERQTLMSLLQKLVNSNNELSRAPLEAIHAMSESMAAVSGAASHARASSGSCRLDSARPAPSARSRSPKCATASRTCSAVSRGVRARIAHARTRSMRTSIEQRLPRGAGP